jgi:catechol 2,3-dioxygenase-like lactoylglutathione lyase family enzyme
MTATMFNLPQPILGEITAITINTPDLNKSLQYYQRLGFAEVMRFNFPFPWIQVSDGALLIMLRQDNNPYLALTYYSKETAGIAHELEKKGIVFAQKPKADDMIKGYLFQSPDGLNISIVDIVDGFKQPTGPTMLTMSQEDYMKPEKYVNKVCGMWGEFAVTVKDLEYSISFWEKLGFIVLSKYPSPNPWAILSDGLSIIGLHQATEFTNPAITYFAADMQSKIDELKKNGLDNYKDHSPGNCILTTPEQQQIFLFNFGM